MAWSVPDLADKFHSVPAALDTTVIEEDLNNGHRVTAEKLHQEHYGALFLTDIDFVSSGVSGQVP